MLGARPVGRPPSAPGALRPQGRPRPDEEDAGPVRRSGPARGLGVPEGHDASAAPHRPRSGEERSEEHTSELQSLMRISYAVFCLKKNNQTTKTIIELKT